MSKANLAKKNDGKALTMNYFETALAKTYIDFFAGCGGLSLGLGHAKWKGIFAIEKDPMAFATLYENQIRNEAPYSHFENWPVWLTKEPHAIEDILDNLELRNHLSRLKGQITLIAGGPPCQGFSVAGSRDGNDSRNLLVFRQIQAMSVLRPLFGIIENVGGFERRFVSRPIDGKSISVADEALSELGDLGYNVGKVIIDATDYGVPQIRKRVIIFAIAKEFCGELNAAELLRDTLAEIGTEQRSELGLSVDRPVNVEEAISDLSGEEMVVEPEFNKFFTSKYLPIQSSYQELMRRNTTDQEIPSCHRFNKHSPSVIALYKKAQKTQPPGRLSKEFLYENNCHSNKRFVLDTKRPSSTLTTAPEEFIHYSIPRVVTLREMARLQSFPDDFRFLGRYTLNGPARGIDVPRNAQIGNAIPPLVGMALGKALDRITNRLIVGDESLGKYRYLF